jgi:hypothetical protein
MQPSSHAIAMPRPVKKKTCALASEIVCCWHEEKRRSMTLIPLGHACPTE